MIGETKFSAIRNVSIPHVEIHRKMKNQNVKYTDSDPLESPVQDHVIRYAEEGDEDATTFQSVPFVPPSDWTDVRRRQRELLLASCFWGGFGHLFLG